MNWEVHDGCQGALTNGGGTDLARGISLLRASIMLNATITEAPHKPFSSGQRISSSGRRFPSININLKQMNVACVLEVLQINTQYLIASAGNAGTQRRRDAEPQGRKDAGAQARRDAGKQESIFQYLYS